jgi:hypothetical protein
MIRGWGELIAGALTSAGIAVVVALAAAGYIFQGCR